MAKYLDNVKLFVSPEQFERTKMEAQQFLAGDAKLLHQKLLERAGDTPSFLCLSHTFMPLIHTDNLSIFLLQNRRMLRARAGSLTGGTVGRIWTTKILS